MNKLAEIQQKLKAPKSHKSYNYNYRNLEDILEAVKPLLGEATLTIQDEIVMIGTRFYVKAIATLKDGKDEWINTAYARESENKKGMDDSQVTGSSSSYARKYCLNGLFAIDDTKDADAQEKEIKTQYISKKPEELKVIANLMKIATKEEAKRLYIELNNAERENKDILEVVEILKNREKITKDIK